MNSMEQTVGNLLDKQDKILWWFRNKATKDGYAIQGWKKGNIYPDFVAAKKANGGKLELVYIIESKGEHLLGNDNTTYKKKVLDLMTRQHKEGKIERIQQTDLFPINEKVAFHLVEQGKEEESIKGYFK